MDTVTLGLFIAGLALLIVGAEVLVRGAARLARSLGISPIIIGLTVVAYCTSAPEMAVGLQASLGGEADIALGNVVGSNIFNVLFILGISALIVPLIVHQRLIQLDVPLMIGLSAAVFLMALDGRIGRVDGLLLVLGGIAYTIFTVRASRQTEPDVQQEYEKEFDAGRQSSRVVDVLLIAGGLVMLVLGARWLVGGAVSLARVLGLSELIIGLTIIAAGTSLPEVATSVIASLRGERDIAVGNVVGSNIFNLLFVLGACGLASAQGIAVPTAALRLDLPVMLAVAFACLPIFFSGYRIARWEGALLFGYYVAYTIYLVLDAVGHDALPTFSAVMLLFVVPLTILTLAVVVVRQTRLNRAGASS